jgi:glycerate dehydrogenase
LFGKEAREMKIVVLDGYTLNPGDLSWGELEGLGDVTIYDRTPKDKVLERALGAEIVFTNKTVLGEEELSKLTELKYIGVLATGYNVIDMDAVRKRGVVVTNVPSYSTKSVAQITFALLLELCHHVQEHSDEVRSGAWSRSIDFSFWNYPLIELDNKTMGIIGFGSIGKQVADIAAAFGMKVIAYSRTKTDQSNRSNFKWVELDELFSMSDIISLHCPLFPETKEIINRDSINKMKESVIIINTSRGPLINEEELAEALNSGRISAAAVDVLSTEPPQRDNPLLSAKNCVVTPHIAWAAKEARQRLMNTAVENLKAFLKGQPQNVV